MKRVRLTRALAVCAASIALLVPGLGSADTVPETCGGFGTCVRAVLDSMSISCFTNSEHRPQCAAIARVGGTGTLSGGFYGAELRFQAYASGGKITNPVPAPVTCCRVFRSTMDSRVFYGDRVTITDNLRAPFAVGPVGGCLRYGATFLVFAQNFIRGPGGVTPLGSVSRHGHNIEQTKGYCVPQ